MPRYTGGTEGYRAVVEAATSVVMNLEDSATRIALMDIVLSKHFVSDLYPTFRAVAQTYKGAELEKRLRECFYSRLQDCYPCIEVPECEHFDKFSLCGLTWYTKQKTGRKCQVCGSKML